MPYLPALDGLRAIAVMAVLLFHVRAPFATGGFLGVDVFFVLSGFLITALISNELEKTGTISITQFYKRRLLRLMPALMALLAFYAVFAPIIWPDHGQHLVDGLLALLYLSDYGVAYWGSPLYLGHTWSLSVEEHFYVLWPLALICLRKLDARRLLGILLATYVVATLWRIYCSTTEPWEWTYYRFDTRSSGLLLGAVIAVAWRTGLPAPIGRFAAHLGIGIMALVFVLARWKSATSLQLACVAIEWATAATIIALLQAPGPGWLSSAPLIYLGRISYGTYLYHYPIVRYLRAAPEAEWWLTLLLGGGLSLLLAMISYHSIEAWARAMKRPSAH